MNLNVKSIGSIICLAAIYIGLGIVGLYHAIGVVLFPIIAVPAIVCFIKDTLNKEQHIILHMIIGVGIYLTTNNLICILIYLLSVCIPSYVIIYFYRQEYPLPNIIMHVTLALAIVVLSFFMLMKYFGLDFESYYLETLENIKYIFLDNVQEWLTIQNTNLSSSNLASLSLEMRQAINSVIAIMEAVYSALIILQLLIASGITVIVVNVIIGYNDKKIPSLKQLLSFRLSKVSVLILFISTITISLNGDVATNWSILSLNITFFLMTLFQMVGTLALVAIVGKADINRGIKIIGLVTIVILLLMSPYLVMFFGCLDTIFNYRKVKIVV